MSVEARGEMPRMNWVGSAGPWWLWDRTGFQGRKWVGLLSREAHPPGEPGFSPTGEAGTNVGLACRDRVPGGNAGSSRVYWPPASTRRGHQPCARPSRPGGPVRGLLRDRAVKQGTRPNGRGLLAPGGEHLVFSWMLT